MWTNTPAGLLIAGMPSSKAGAATDVKDEGTTVVAAPNALNFVGANVAVTDGGGGTATVTISGASVAIKEEGTTVVATPTAMNFVGANVTVTDGGGGTAVVTITGGSGGGSVGDYASVAALEAAHPAASNPGATGTVNGALYKANDEGTPAWVALLTYESGSVWAANSALEATYTQAQLDALLLGRGNVISRASRPIIRPSSGSSNATGLITMSTGLNASWTIPGSSLPCWIYLPANVVTGIAVAQLHAGVITAATTVQLNGSPTTANAAYTTDAASFLPLHTFTLTANEFGANGELEIVAKSTHAGTMTSAHEIQFQINGTTFGGTSNNTTSYISRVSTGRLIGRGKDAASQIGMWDVAAGVTSNTAQDTISTFLTVDTTSSQTVGVYLKAPVGSTVVLDMVRATLWKS
jgi:hypothetical protein